ncbi:hypothetical protein B7P33_03795 [Sediminicola luteus]|uniref:Galactose oxidase n=1 Tax=Sediminicola luteus TaxID=319238 RepID=A0A2A4GEJ4_9FLAO|nr:hypothetical protein B7P33_03795 [Sediminicola luteus]
MTLGLAIWTISCEKSEVQAVTPPDALLTDGKIIVKNPQPTTLIPKEMSKSVPFNARHGHEVLVFHKKLWVIAGDGMGDFYNDVWASEDGLHWETMVETAPFLGRRHFGASVMQDQIWLVGGELGQPNNLTQTNEVWTSKNGSEWFQVEPKSPNAIFSPRRRHTLTTFNDKLFLVAGGTHGTYGQSRNDVWSTKDGAEWKIAIFNAPFAPREDHAALVFEDRLWIVGGFSKTTGNPVFLNDVWFTKNGVDWHQATENAAFTARRGHSLTTDGDYMYLIGGDSEDYVYHNDIWRSANGIDWEMVTTEDSSFGPRSDHASVYFNQLHWIINGYPIYSAFENGSVDQWGFYDDIWAFETN